MTRDSNHLEHVLSVATQAAKTAGEYLRSQFDLADHHQAEFKQLHDVGLAADRESEQIILNVIQSDFPDLSIVAEESGVFDHPGDETLFIDPLDGTNNFFCGIPVFCVSIALVDAEDILLGVIYHPVTDALFTAIRGKGAYLNGNQLKTSTNKTTLDKATVAFVKGHRTYQNPEWQQEAKQIKGRLESTCRRVLTHWAPAFDWSLLAAGKIDGIVSYESELEDQLAGTLITREAGVNVTNFTGSDYCFKERRIIGGIADGLGI